MKIAIQNKSTGFHPYWIAYCEQHNIPFKLVDCYQNDIIKQLEDCDALMWHHNQSGVKDILFAKQLLFSLEQAGKVVFPNFNTAWHFDDKVAQKYLLEALGLPLVNTFVFYDRKEALNWAEKTTFPKVFKLRGGAGASNVKLAKTKKEAVSLINQAFGRGFSQYDAFTNIKERYRKYHQGIGSVKDIAKGIARIVKPPQFAKVKGNDVGYIYFQEFIPDNDSDIRVVVVGDKAVAMRRMIRENDFRASGSGISSQDRINIPDKVIKLAFFISDKLKCQSLAIDFIFDQNLPVIVELSYGFLTRNYQGYWDKELNYIKKTVSPISWMVETVVKQIKANQIQI